MNLSLPEKRKPYLMAHRGNSVACPENTLAAFERAFEEGADILETDVHLTADGTFVCIHDARVDRTTNGTGAVAEMTLDELRALSACYGRREFAEERIPTLDEVVALVPPGCALALELKSDRFLEPEVCRRLVAEVNAGGLRDRFFTISFSLARMRAVQAAAPGVPVGHITLRRLWPTTGVQFHGPLWPALLINPLYTWMAHRRGQMVCPLDVEPERRLRLYLALGCDAVMSNDPGTTRRALVQQGLKV